MNEKKKDFANELYVNMSGLQKSVRRGNVTDALRFGKRILNGGTGGKKVLVTRLFTFLVEDVGFATPLLADLMNYVFGLDSYEKFDDESVKDILSKVSREDLLKLVAIFTKSPKNRETDSFVCSKKYGLLEGESDDVEFFGKFLNEHSYLSFEGFKKKLKEDAMTLESFSSVEFSKTPDKKSAYGKYEESLSKMADSLIYRDNYLDDYVFQSFKKSFSFFRECSNGKDGGLLFWALFRLWGKNGWSFQEWGDWETFETKSENMKASFENMKMDETAVSDISDAEIPDYVYDKHTAEGRKLKKGAYDFFTEGTKLVNEIEFKGNVYAKIIEANLEKIREGDAKRNASN